MKKVFLVHLFFDSSLSLLHVPKSSLGQLLHATQFSHKPAIATHSASPASALSGAAVLPTKHLHPIQVSRIRGHHQQRQMLCFVAFEGALTTRSSLPAALCAASSVLHAHAAAL